MFVLALISYYKRMKQLSQNLYIYSKIRLYLTLTVSDMQSYFLQSNVIVPSN